MRSDYLGIVAIVCIALLELVALIKGINGRVLETTLVVMAFIVGLHYGRRLKLQVEG